MRKNILTLFISIFFLTGFNFSVSENVRLKLIDNTTGKIIPNSAFYLYWDNGVRCIQAPCTNAVVENHDYTTDAKGIAEVPMKIFRKHVWNLCLKNGGGQINVSSSFMDSLANTHEIRIIPSH